MSVPYSQCGEDKSEKVQGNIDISYSDSFGAVVASDMHSVYPDPLHEGAVHAVHGDAKTGVTLRNHGGNHLPYPVKAVCGRMEKQHCKQHCHGQQNRDYD